MRVAIVGGGPGGLYSAILLRKAFPEAEVRVLERNRPDDTYGWGVVFSDETLGNFREADEPTHRRITDRFRYWTDIETYYGGTCVTSTGHGFAALSRRVLLEILHRRCRELGVELEFEHEVESLEALRAEADLVVGADGVNSTVRRRYEAHFDPEIDLRLCRFCWLGTTKPLEAFTFIFRESDAGLFQVHAYPFEDGLATWIVECREEVWRRAGLEGASEEETVAFCAELFADDLDGHELLTNKSIWRRFPTVRCDTWHLSGGQGSGGEEGGADVVLLGDAAHTAHFSIGSGTKLAMEDAIALVEALGRSRGEGLGAALQAYEDARWVDVVKTQKAAQTSLEWFENSARYLGQHPLQFSFNLLTRSKRITYDNLRRRDPELVAAVDRWFRAARAPTGAGTEAGAYDGEGRGREGGVSDEHDADRRVATPAPDDGSTPRRSGGPPCPPPDRDEPGTGGQAAAGKAPPPIFTPFTVGGLELANRIAVSPMCQYSAVDGTPGDWHLVHLGSRALGGAGLVMTEMTDVTREGRITHGCAGLYRDAHVAAWRRIVDFVHRHSRARIGIQLAHAGRKGSVHHPWEGDDVPLAADEGAWETLAPSAVPFRPGWPTPRAMDRDDMDRVRDAFVRATERAAEAGFDLVELHMAHGYLLSSFISPLSNRRDDEYGGSLENRMRYPLEVLAAVRAAWGEGRPLAVRITASDWMPDGSGLTGDDAVEVARRLAAAGCDLVDVSSGGNVPDSRPLYGRMYQVPFAERIRHEVGVPVMAVGAILGADHANTVVAAGRADLAAMARPHLRDPYLTLHAAETYELWDHPWPDPYLPARPRPPRPAVRRDRE